MVLAIKDSGPGTPGHNKYRLLLLAFSVVLKMNLQILKFVISRIMIILGNETFSRVPHCKSDARLFKRPYPKKIKFC